MRAVFSRKEPKIEAKEFCVEKVIMLPAGEYESFTNHLMHKHDFIRENVDFMYEKDGIPIPPQGKYIFGAVTVGEKGQIVIPKKAREIFHIQAGDTLVVLGDEAQGLAMISSESMMQKLNEMQRLMKKRDDAES